MIIKCPECETSFLVPAESLSPDGRKVRCSNCHTEWFQKFKSEEEEQKEENERQELDEAAKESDQEPEESHGESEEAMSASGEDKAEGNKQETGDMDIPEALKPESDENELESALEHEQGKNRRADKNSSVLSKRAAGYLYAAAITFFIWLAFTFSAPYVTSLWPASVFYYKSLGMNYKLAGEDLEFDRLKAQAVLKKDAVIGLKLSGDILNKSEELRKIPGVGIILLEKDQSQKIDSWVPQSLSDRVEGKEAASFDITYPETLAAQAKYVKIWFMPDRKFLSEKDSMGTESILSKTAPEGD